MIYIDIETNLAHDTQPCSSCNESKPTSKFTKDSRRSNGYSKVCKQCTNDKVASLRKQRREYIHKYKLDRGCSVCGYKESAVALQFDHVNPEDKCFNISTAVATRSLPAIEDEIAKCRILCANCHAIHTHQEEL